MTAKFPNIPVQPLPPFSAEQVFIGTVAINANSAAPPDASASVEFVPLRVIGEGGMGIVYRALQRYPERVVALKVLKNSLASSRPRRRFDREIAILARLHHRGIAQLFCVGIIDQGLAGHVPFMALEYIEGEYITHYADRKQLKTRDRLELLLHVCDAISYAHSQGVIHRDLKPGNILVDAAGFPKVLDFGLALLRDENDRQSQLTEDGEGMGTIDYASPEQISGNHSTVDERTDVYALGVILFELLTGARPYTFEGCVWSDAAWQMFESQPADLSKHDRSYRGDLETIVLKAMARERSIRYVSILELANDLRRYLANQPIHAKPPTRLYRAKKFIQRHRVLVTAATLIFISLVTGLVIAANEAHKARIEAARANRETFNAQAQLAQSQLAQGDALLGLQRFDEARDLYDRSWDISEKLGLSTLPAEVAEWELNTKAAVPLQVLSETPFDIQNGVYSSSQHKIALGFSTGRLELRNLATGKTDLAIEMGKPINRLCLSPNGKFLLVVLRDSIQIWGLDSEKLLRQCDMTDSLNSRMCISNTMLAAVTGEDAQFFMIDPKRPMPILHLSSDVSAFQLVDDTLLTVNKQGILNQEINGMVQRLGEIPISQEMFFSSDGVFLVVREADSCSVFDCKSPANAVARVPVIDAATVAGFAGHDSLLFLNQSLSTASIVDFSGRSRVTFPVFRTIQVQTSFDYAISNDRKGRCILWRFAQDASIRSLVSPEEKPRAQAMSADGEIVAVVTREKKVVLIDCLSGWCLGELSLRDIPTALRFIDQTRKLVLAFPQTVSNPKNRVEIWDSSSRKLVVSLDVSDRVTSIGSDGISPVFFVGTAAGHVIKIYGDGEGWAQKTIPTKLLATSIDVERYSDLVCIGSHEAGELWDVNEPVRRMSVLNSSTHFNRNFSFASKGTKVVALDNTGNLRSWDLLGHEIACLPTDSGMSSSVAGSDQSVLIESDSHCVDLRDISTGQVIRQLCGIHSDVCWSQDGQHVVMRNGTDGTTLLDLESPRRFREARRILGQTTTRCIPAERFHSFALVGLTNKEIVGDGLIRASDLLQEYDIEHVLAFVGTKNILDATACVNRDSKLTAGTRLLFNEFIQSTAR